MCECCDYDCNCEYCNELPDGLTEAIRRDRKELAKNPKTLSFYESAIKSIFNIPKGNIDPAKEDNLYEWNTLGTSKGNK